MTLCASCQDASDRWLDYRLPRAVKIASGATYDDTGAGVRDSLTNRFELWRNTITKQQAVIRTICEKQHQTPEVTP